MAVAGEVRARRRLGLAALGADVLRAPFLLACLASILLAVISALTLPTVPSYDPWSWIVWGREVFDPHLSFYVGGGPSWKPLPVIFTAFYGPIGHASPTLWVITARAGGFLALIGAYRLGALLVRGGRGRPGSVAEPVASWEPIAAGLIAAVGILLTQDFFYYMFRGTSEPMLIGLSLWAIDRHLAGRHVLAFLLMVAASLIRPEWWPFVILYGIWLYRRDRRPWLAALILIGWISIPFFWFVPPWISTGQPFLAATHAQDYNGHLGSDPFLTVIARGINLQSLPWLVLAAVAVAITWWRERDRLILGLAAAAAAWWVLVIAMTLDGYPGLERFYLPAAGVICVLGGVGLVRAARLVGLWVTAHRSALLGPRLAWLAAAILVAVSIPFTISRVNTARAAEPTAAQAVTRLNGLSAAVAVVGGHDGVFPCKSSFAAVNHSVQTALAWKLHVTLERVGTSMHAPGLMFIGPHDSIDGGPPAIDPRLTRIQLIKQVGVWRIYRASTPGLPTGCIGS